MEWQSYTDDHGDVIVESDSGKLRLYEYEGMVRIVWDLDGGFIHVPWIPVPELSKLMPAHNCDCHNLRNAVQLLLLAEGEDIMDAALEVRARLDAMRDMKVVAR